MTLESRTAPLASARELQQPIKDEILMIISHRPCVIGRRVFGSRMGSITRVLTTVLCEQTQALFSLRRILYNSLAYLRRIKTKFPETSSGLPIAT